MNHRHVTIAADLTQGKSFSVNLNVPWPSIMTVRQITYAHNGTDGPAMIWTGFAPDAGIIGSFYDSISVSPQTRFHIQKALLGTFQMKILDVDLDIADQNFGGHLFITLEFEPAIEKVELKLNH